MTQIQTISREDFMGFFRNDESLATLSADDRHEIFYSIMLGSSDFTKELLDDVLKNYCVENLEVIDRSPQKD